MIPCYPNQLMGSTKDYDFENTYEPVLVIDKTLEHIVMTREEFEEHNLYRLLFNSLKYYYTDDSIRKFSMKYKMISNYTHKLIQYNIEKDGYINRKAPGVPEA
jgi:hypothetical protein